MNRRKLLLAASIFCSAAVVAPASAQEFETIQGATLTHVSAGQAEVWGINASQEVFRFNATNGEFVQVAEELTQVAVAAAPCYRRTRSGDLTQEARFSVQL